MTVFLEHFHSVPSVCPSLGKAFKFSFLFSCSSQLVNAEGVQEREYSGVGKSNFTKFTFEYAKTVYLFLYISLISYCIIIIIIINLFFLTSVLEAISTPIAGYFSR